jgi:CheY-like chemotaxis protein
MNVLITDDDAMTRSLLRRVLVREFAATVTEAADGLEALSAAGANPPDLIITDLRMPVMDGIALLEALRQVEPLSTIPVVMMTAARESTSVERAIELGVTDYLLKPLQVAQVNGRLRGVVDRITRRLEGVEGDAAPELDEHTPVLIADGNGDFRHFVATTLGSQRAVHQAPSGLAALQRYGQVRPGIVLVGGELGVLGPELLMRKLRRTAAARAPRLFLVVPKSSIDQAAASTIADGVLARTFVGDDFRTAFERQIARLKLKPPVAARPTLGAQLAGIAGPLFQAMLQRDVTVSTQPVPRPVDEMVVASAALTLGDGADVEELTLVVRTDGASAAALAAVRSGGAAASIDPGGKLSAVAEAAGALAAKVAAALEEEAGARVVAAPAATRAAASGDLAEAAAGVTHLAVESVEGGLQFVVQLESPPLAGVAAGTVVAAAAPES